MSVAPGPEPPTEEPFAAPPAPASSAPDAPRRGRAAVRRHGAWALALLIVAGAGVAGAAYAWTHACEGPPAQERGFRLDRVFLLEHATDGNETRFAVVPWYSNPGASDLGDLRLVVYLIESGRGMAVATAHHDAGPLRAATTQNASLDLQLNHTRQYTIEILVLEDDFLVATGTATIGRRTFSLEDGRATFVLAVRDLDVRYHESP